MRGPSHTSYSIFVAWQDSDWAGIGRTDIKGANKAVDTSSSNDCVSIFIPIVCKGLRGRHADRGSRTHAGFWRGMYRDVECEMVGCGGRGSEVEDT
jgi:hypothetical protein